MNKLIREHFNVFGVPKRPYFQDEAQEMAYHYQMDAYECGFCSMWHVGNPVDKGPLDHE